VVPLPALARLAKEAGLDLVHAQASGWFSCLVVFLF